MIDPVGSASFGDITVSAAVVADAVTAASIARGATADEPVALLVDHRAAAVAAVIGVLAAGHPLLMLDPLAPPPRSGELAARVGARLCVADAVHDGTARQVVAPGGQVLAAPARVSGARTRGVADLDDLWRYRPDPGAPALLAITSGSTGGPKVVMIDQRLMMAHTWAESTSGGCYSADDVMAHTLPMAFNAGFLVTLAGPLVGATMALYDVRKDGIGGLGSWIERTGPTVLHTSPAILRALVQSAPRPEQLAALRSLTVAGEPSHGRDIEAARRLLPPTCTIYNRYGSTETSLIAEYLVRPGDPPVTGVLPSGRPVGHTRVTLVDEAGQPVAPGESGIVVVHRDQLALGYRDDPERTAATFRAGPDGTRSCFTNDVGRFDSEGVLHLLGRRDHSVKVRGFLVEPGEVDAALLTLPEVREAVTVGVPHQEGGGHRLVAYVVPAGDRTGAPAIRAGLRAVLPGHMVPATIVFLEALPRTARGKIDRGALPSPPPSVTGTTPESVWEGIVAEAWGWVLDLDEVPRDADFFELGGDSLAAEALITLVTGHLGVPADGVTPALLAEAPTVAEFAARLRRRPDPRHPTLTQLRTGGSRPPLFLVAGGGALGVGFVPLARHLDGDQPCYALHSHGLEYRAVPDWSVRSAARRHLRTLRNVQPRGPYYLGGHSFGGLLALEMARQLHRSGERVELLVILDSFPPNPALLPRPPRTLMRRVRAAAGVALTGIVPAPGRDQYWRFHAQSLVLSRHYSPPPFPGSVLVIVSDSDEREARASWAPHLTGPWQLRRVPGDHRSFLREPYVATTADLVTQALRQAHGESAAVSRPP